VPKGETVVAIYNLHTETETAIKKLQRAGIDMRQISVIGKDCTEQYAVGYYNTGDRMQYWGKLGTFWGGIWGLLVGSAFLWMPGLGPILVGGPFVSSIVGTLEGATTYGGLSALGAALYSTGIPRSSVINYEGALRANKFLLILQGSMEEIARGEKILRDTEAIELAEHNAARMAEPGRSSTSPKAGAGAVKQFRAQSDDLVIVNVELGVIDGVDTARTIRSWELMQELEPTPIIALTTTSSGDPAPRDQSGGFIDYLVKPFNQAQLLGTIRRHARSPL
jgi:CheY-like chemotaxis protein